MPSNEPTDCTDRHPISTAGPLEQAIGSHDLKLLKAIVTNAALSQELALALLKRADLPGEVLEQLSKKPVAKDRKVQQALVAHPKTPRYVSGTIVRQMFTFELMQAALTPIVPADVKKAAEEALLKRLETLTSGERFTLARRASGRVAAALLLDREARISHAALDNAKLTETHLVKALTGRKAGASFVHAVCAHPKWPLRRDIKVALLRHEKLPLSHALEYARGLPAKIVREILRVSTLPAPIKQRVLDAIHQ
jgi:hypothetical protein